MNFLLDNNLPPALAHALNALAEHDEHSVVALRDKFAASTSDIDWIEALAGERNWVVISQDHFTKREGLEKEAIIKSGLTVFCLKKGWAGLRYWEKAHNLVRWFPEIANQAERITGGGSFWVPLKGHKFDPIF